MAQLLKANGEQEDIKVDELTLKKLQSLVGGYVERVVCFNNNVLYVNDEARLTGLPYNSLASSVANMPILGDAVLLAKIEDLEWQASEGRSA